jgi:hypothetical protein
MEIPKVIVQTHWYKHPQYVIDMIKEKSVGWEYKHFIDDEIIEFIKDNPIEDFNNSIEIYNSIKVPQHKADFFRYYYLYLNGGVYMDCDTMLQTDINQIVKNLDFFSVISDENNKNCIFNGFIGTIPKHPIIHQALKHIYDNYNTDNYLLYCIQLKSIIDFYIYYNPLKKDKIKLFEEYRFTNIILIKDLKSDLNDIVLIHYCKTKIVPAKNIPKKTSAKKIGVTCCVKPHLLDLFSNGAIQNSFYFTEVLSNIGYDVDIIVDDKVYKNCDESVIKLINYNNLKIVKYNCMLTHEYDVVFSFGFTIDHIIISHLKNMNTKFIYYNVGNEYIIDTESILYNNNKSNTFNYENTKYDQIWLIPQMVNTNKHYLELLYKSKTIEVPFIWSSKSITFSALISNAKDENELLYKRKNTIVAVFEPNLSIMKWCLPSLLICEKYNKEKNNKIERVHLNNTTDKDGTSFNMEKLNQLVFNLDIAKAGKVSIETRFNTLQFMKIYADFVVSHQIENNLNYLWLELAWMGWPVIHNGSLCKDVGYYYEGFDFDMAVNVLNDAILNHDKNNEDYIIRNRKVIDRYLPSNLELQQKYKKLIDDLFV